VLCAAGCMVKVGNSRLHCQPAPALPHLAMSKLVITLRPFALMAAMS
jgi:hypothetical protein